MSQPCYASCFVPSNLETAHYDVISLMATPQGRPVAIMRSKSPSDYCWCILRGFSTIFFTSRSDAESYCNKHHFTNFKGGRQHE